MLQFLHDFGEHAATVANRVQLLTESVIRETSPSPRALAINLGQGDAGLRPPAVVKAAGRAIRDGFNQDAVTPGLALWQAIATKMRRSQTYGSQFSRPEGPVGQKLVRYVFAKRDETLHAAGERLLGLRKKLA